MLNEKVIGEYVYLVSDECKVGVGQFSHVYKGYHEKTKKQVAIKQIDKKQIKGIFEQMLRNEINILKQLNHQYILKMYAYYETSNNFYIITEFCETDVLQILKNQGSLPEEKVIAYVLQISEALKYLNSKKIIHRDIKPSNILIHEGEVRLADFGFAVHQDKVGIEDRQFQIGSPLYMSPETLLKNQYNHKTDLWSLGVLYFEMIFGVVPFFSIEMDDLLRKLQQYQQDYILTFKYPVSEASTEAIRNLLAYDPSHRCEIRNLELILKNYYSNRAAGDASIHSQKRTITPDKRKKDSPNQSPENRSKAQPIKKELVKVSCSAKCFDKNSTYFTKNKPNKEDDQQNSKREENLGTDRKDNEAIHQISGIRLHDLTVYNEKVTLENMSNEDFLAFLIKKLESVKRQDPSQNIQINECQLLLV
ncbi:unnamed protein product (macronuclear) [Paramecium tetraurelia]|uniref:non-specific serine/threonine protein kinase n=1 Tax=Paramecium tetraurelia TaxID=5888 RepID=A0DY84_PARTE|nr:uncharacterized protein GSPATT00002969001 [Paramecium tetraurelia]CAK88001.1 unnamed protein product [Paramecium tetraurelia]|eukprot:XP_001455398.1 hypothetical protein (macronuclear) [Paramecium tetraurelia strain d4-2]